MSGLPAVAVAFGARAGLMDPRATAAWLTRQELAAVEARITAQFDPALSSELDRLHVALEAVEAARR